MAAKGEVEAVREDLRRRRRGRASSLWSTLLLLEVELECEWSETEGRRSGSRAACFEETEKSRAVGVVSGSGRKGSDPGKLEGV